MTNQRGPDKTQLRRYLERGLTQAQIAAAWEQDTGVRVARSTIGMAITRHGLQSVKPRPRYEDMMPWQVSNDHRMANDARMLRLEARRRRGERLERKKLRLLNGWRTQLERQNAVVIYDARTPDGFYWVERQTSDRDIIRWPAHAASGHGNGNGPGA